MESNGFCAKHNRPKVYDHPDIWYPGYICSECSKQIEAEIEATNQSAKSRIANELAEARRILGFAGESAK